MKILILTQYYPPEIGAPQNRLHELAIRLKNKGLRIEVLTALPNYPKMKIFERYKDKQNAIRLMYVSIFYLSFIQIIFVIDKFLFQ